MSDQPTTYLIDLKHWGHVQDKLAKLQVRAVLLGAPLTVTLGEIIERREYVCGAGGFTGLHSHTANCPEAVYRLQEISVESEPIKLGGWELLARQVREGGGIIINAVPGLEVPHEFRDTPATRCDHCGTRRARKDTYLVQRENDVKQVGSTCLRDFLGHDPEAILRFFHNLTDFLLRLGEPHERTVEGISLAHFAAQVIAETEAHGWLSRTNARESGGEPTANRAWESLFPSSPERRRLSAETTDAHYAAATAAVEWAAALPDGGTDYESNIRTIARQGYVTYRLAGYAASIPAACARQIARDIEWAQDAREGQASTYQGTVGQRQEWGPLTVTLAREIETEYGVSLLIKFIDTGGNRFAWFASSASLDAGDVVTLRGTVKGHAEYKGVQETKLSRCTILERKGAQA